MANLSSFGIGQSSGPIVSESDPKVMSEVDESGEIVEEEKTEVKLPTYRRNDIRDWQVAEYQFTNYLYTPRTVEENDAWLRLFDKLPEIDRNNIVVFDAEAFASITKPVSSVRGTLLSSQINEPKTNPAIAPRTTF